MNRAKLQKISTDIADALRDVGERHGVQITTGAGTYALANATLRLEIADIGEDGEAQTPEREAFARYAKWQGISPDALGAVFESGGESYRITGWRAKARKRPVQTERVRDGRTYVWPASDVRRFLPESLRLERSA